MKLSLLCHWCNNPFITYDEHAKYCGIPCKSEGLKTPINFEELKVLQEQGLTQEKLAAHFHTSSQVIGRALKRYGLPPCERQQSGTKSPNWKGDTAGYHAFHERVRRQRGKANHCEVCGKDDPDTRYEWANLTGNYADILDYRSMCARCHKRFDFRKPFCKRGHEMTGPNTITNKDGSRKCRTCTRMNERLNYRKNKL